MKKALLLILIAPLLVCAVAYAQNFTLNFNLSLDSVPAVSSVSASVSQNSATIVWLTDMPADSQVEYGTTASYGSTTVLDETLAQSHSVTISGMDASTIYHFRILSADASGFMQPTADQTFTTSPPSSPPPSPPPSSGGGGGPSSSAGPPPATSASAAPLDSIKFAAQNVSSGNPAKFVLPANFTITSLVLTASSSLNNVEIDVKKIDSVNVPAPLTGVVYKYLRIDAINASGLDYREINYEVPQSWLGQHDFTTDDIKMLRYTDMGWERLQTYFSNTTNGVNSFYSVTPGFSVFAIIGEKSAAQLNNQSAAEEVNTSTAAFSIPPIISPDSGFPINLQYFIISAALFVMALLLYALRRRRRTKSETPTWKPETWSGNGP